MAVYSPVHNIHKNSILDITIAPADIDEDTKKRALDIACRFVNLIDDYGIYCIEMFLDKNGEIYINEIAPRPHNSGHYTIEACITSQFEQHVRSILNLPLGSTKQIMGAVMKNIIGDVDIDGDYYVDNVDEIMSMEGVYLHLYGKANVKIGRKMGHITMLSNDIDLAFEKLKDLKVILRGGC